MDPLNPASINPYQFKTSKKDNEKNRFLNTDVTRTQPLGGITAGNPGKMNLN